MTELVFDAAAFRVQFPVYANATTYTTPALQSFWNMAIIYISPTDYGFISGDSRQRALNMMVAHLTYLQDMLTSGTAPQMVNSSSVDKISVSLTPPSVKNQWAWWLNLSPYGQQLQALLSIRGGFGMYSGGSLARAGFRQPAGGFLA